MDAICQAHLPVRPWAESQARPLPGVKPVTPGEWFLIDDAYAPQMALRERLLRERRDEVVRIDARAAQASGELLTAVLAEIAAFPGFTVTPQAIDCPDGRRVVLDFEAPLETAARLVQDDLVVMQKPPGGDEHLLTAAVLCFPASWSLEEKFLRPLTAIHSPVAEYDADIARRVQRLCDGIQPGKPVWRANALTYDDPELFQPRRDSARRDRPTATPGWMRVERQALARLAQSGAIAFTIHTYVVPIAGLSPEDRATVMANAAPAD